MSARVPVFFCRVFSRAARPRSAVLDVLAAAAAPRAAEFKPQELAQLLHAFGGAGRVPAAGGWCAHMWDVGCAASLERFTAQELAMVLCALARLKHSPGDAALRAAAAQLGARAAECDLQALSNAMWAMALLWEGPEAAPLAPLLQRVAALLPGATSPQAVANVLWAAAKLRHDPGAAFVTAAVARALAFGAALGPADLAQLCFSLERLQYAPGPRAVDALAAAMDAQLPAYRAAELTVVLHALARLGWDPAEPAALRLQAHVTAQLASARAPKLAAAMAALGLAPAA